MTLPPLPLIDGCLFVDHSYWVEPMMTCQRLLEYQSLHQRVSSAERSALNFGTAQHLAREYRYKCYKTSPLDQTYHDTVALLFEEFFRDHPTPEGDFRTLNWAVEVSKHYDEKYAIEQHNLLQYNEPQPCSFCEGQGEKSVDSGEGDHMVPCPFCRSTGKNDVMVELSFALPLFTWKGKLPVTEQEANHTPETFFKEQTIPVFYTGRIDLPYTQDNQIWIRDIKTTSMLGSQFWDKMRMLAQARGYCWAFEQLTKKKVTGYQIDAIRTKEPPQYVINGTPGKGGKAVNPETWWNESLARERFYLKDGELDQWKNNVIELLEEFFWHYSRGYMPMKTAWCTQWGKCQYYDVCNLAPQDRGIMLASGLFMNNEWSPLKKVKHLTQTLDETIDTNKS